MTQASRESLPALYEFAEWVLEDEQRRGWYDDAKMHWIGDPDPAARDEGRHPWVKRLKGHNEYVYSQPVLAAFSIAKRSLMSVRKDPWHSDGKSEAWFVGIHNLETGETKEPKLIEARVSRYGQAWLQMAGSMYPGPPEQRRVEMWLKPGHHSGEARYTNGLREWPELYEDIASLEAMMRMINQTRGVLLPYNLAQPGDERYSYYAPAA